MSDRMHIARVETFVFRAPLKTPVQTSFGLMLDRPMVLVRVTDRDGAFGWGEIWCNFPAVGAEHRARLVDSALAPMLMARPFESPAEAFAQLTRGTEVLALQCAEPGPFAQAIAGLDIACHDLTARRAGLPLWRHLGGSSDRIAVYASGLNPTAPEVLAAARHAEGYRAFKLKIGFGRERDAANLAALRSTLGSEVRLMVDANQAWSLDDAIAQAPVLAPFDLDWLEEPIRADLPWTAWRTLQAATRIPLAAGENVMGEAGFATAINSGVLGVVQPDIAKWGGFSGCLPVARQIRASGQRFCPHYLGGGIGLLASAHLLAAAGGDGALEVDANPNPLRTEIAGPVNRVSGGAVLLGSAPGLGVEDPCEPIRRYLVAS